MIVAEEKREGRAVYLNIQSYMMSGARAMTCSFCSCKNFVIVVILLPSLFSHVFIYIVSEKNKP